MKHIPLINIITLWCLIGAVFSMSFAVIESSLGLFILGLIFFGEFIIGLTQTHKPYE